MTELRDRLQASLGETYRLERELGGGGMSRVFVADETRLDREVVVKVLPPELAAGVERRALRARDPASRRSCSTRTSCPCSRAGETDGLAVLHDAVRRGRVAARAARRAAPLPIVDAVGILRDVARGARLRARARRRPPRHQARQRAARPAAPPRSPTSASRRRISASRTIGAPARR